MYKKIGIMAILVLAVVFFTSSSAFCACVTIHFSAPGDDNFSGTATRYDVRFSKNSIAAHNFDSASKARFVPLPLPVGTVQYIVVSGLESDTQYHFAVKAVDDQDNWSEISNVIAKTAPADFCSGRTGNLDCSKDGMVDLADLTLLNQYLQNNAPICCEKEADLDGDGRIDLTDLSYMIGYLTAGGTLPTCN